MRTNIRRKDKESNRVCKKKMRIIQKEAETVLKNDTKYKRSNVQRMIIKEVNREIHEVLYNKRNYIYQSNCSKSIKFVL